MGMPQNVLSDVAFQYAWRGQDSLDPTDYIDYELGALGVQNTLDGLEYQLWTFDTDGTNIFAGAPTATRQVVFSPGLSTPIEQIRCCFDQNMYPFLCYLSAGQWSYRWYDTTVPGPVITQLPSTVTSVACTLDDKRVFAIPESDVCLFYTNNNNLYYRRQRDRYTIEYLLKATINGTLIKVGMNGINRLQIKLRANLF